ncbi:DUF309 domain-containing protein [Chloroflexia bacterium SDU3-3]|nr:DUF309 domain-containing protein [Chloroflexia bacterium SDU3-3]
MTSGQPAPIGDAHHQGIALFNQQRYWHAHEAWEQCWLGAPEPQATFYQGLIQAAAALVHWQRGNGRGLKRNWYKARPKLVALSPSYAMLDLARLVHDMDRFVLGTCSSPPLLQIDASSGSAENLAA